MSEIIIYEDPDAPNPVQVTLDGDTVWLTQAQMAELFQVKPQNITMHLKRVYADDELQKAATCKEFLQVQAGGTRRVERTRKFYNLDAIISVGYRVNSKRGVRFRQWAASVLKDHLLKGYSLNRHRLAERGVEEARAALDLLARTLTTNRPVSDTGQAVVALISGYARTWRLLDRGLCSG
ncbi:virulence RhuM family protein [Desulfomicrobium salsuginis]